MSKNLEIFRRKTKKLETVLSTSEENGRHEKCTNGESTKGPKHLGLSVGSDSPMQAQGVENIALDGVNRLGWVRLGLV